MAVNLTGCTAQVQAKNLAEHITPKNVEPTTDLSSQNGIISDFALRLFQSTSNTAGNALISPLSVLCALSMTANGANTETLKEMEQVLGMTTEDLNHYLYTYLQNLPQGETYRLSLANSIWFTDDERFAVKKDFLQTLTDYYRADAYAAPFDNQTCKDINNWVKENTDGMIPEILDQIPPNAVMYLINALAFDAQWSEVYKNHQVRDGNFTKGDGTIQKAHFMYSTEHSYLEDDRATGFVKYYKGGKYAFVALLPKDGISPSQYISSLTGDALHELLAEPAYATVYASIPKFESEYSVEMSEILKAMGMTSAFDPATADFTDLGSSTAGNIYINRVLHKTYISVEEEGTRAAAVTAVETGDGAAMVPEDPKEVYLDRPDDLYTFEAAILEIHDSYFLVEPSAGFQEANSSDKIQVSTQNADQSIDWKVGDFVRITYNGQIQELYPAILPQVYKVEKLSLVDAEE